MNHKNWIVSLFVVLAVMLTITLVEAQGPKPKAPTANLGTAFTYQGQLKKNGALVNGSCSLSFDLYDAASGGNHIAGPVNGNPNPATVSNGSFTVQIDFGNVFAGLSEYLQTTVQCPGDNVPTTLSRQPLTPTPYAIYSMNTAWGQSLAGTGGGLYLRSTNSYGLAGIGGAGMIINPLPLGLDAGVYGYGPNEGVYGDTNSGIGVYGTSPSGSGVEGVNTNSGNWGDLGHPYSGVYAVSATGDGVRGYASASNKSGVFGYNDGGGYGVYGTCSGSGCYGLYSNGNARVTGNLQVDGQATGFFPRPAFDSGWQAVTPGQCINVSHNLGGDMNNYLVSLTFHTTDVGMTNSGDGGIYMPSGLRGVWYNYLTNASVQICTGANALTTDVVRFRIWVYN